MESNEISQQDSACHHTCPAVAYQEVTVSVPVTVHPFANHDEITVTCCDEPTIKPIHKCHGTEGGNCRFVINQKLCVAIPIEFGANACVGDPGITCGRPNTEGCSDCTSENNRLPFVLRILTYILKSFLKS